MPRENLMKLSKYVVAVVVATSLASAMVSVVAHEEGSSRVASANASAPRAQ
jgi:hypothetical protein